MLSQIKKGAILSYISLFIFISVALVYTPIMIRLLGQSEYGLYAMVGSIAAYFNILDLGLGNAIVRYTSKNRADGDKAFESKLNGTFLIIYSFIGILTIIVGTVIYYNVDNIFSTNLSVSEIDKAKTMLIILIINFGLSFPLSVFTSIIKAYERFVVDQTITIVRNIAIPLLTLPALFMGYGSVAMVVISTIINIVCLVYGMYYALQKLNIKIKLEFVDKKIIKEIFGYSFFIFLNIIVDKIFWKTDQVILGIVSGTISVAIFSIALQFINLYMKFSTAISNLLLPKLSIMVARNATNHEFTNEMVRYGRIQYLLIAYILSGFIIFGQFFINLWAGENYSKAYYIVLIIMIPLTVPLIQNIGITILQAKNRLAFRAILYLLLSVIKIIVSIPLAMSYEGIGTAFATSFVLFTGHIIIMNIYYNRNIGLDMLLFWKNIFVITIPVVFSTIIGLFLFRTVIPLNSVLYFLIGILIYSIIYFVLNWIFSMNSFEKGMFLSIFNKVKHKFI